MKNSNIGSSIGLGLVISIIISIIAFMFGWFNNINYILDSDFNEVSGREVVAVIGIPVVPIGMANGFIYYFEDEKQE